MSARGLALFLVGIAACSSDPGPSDLGAPDAGPVADAGDLADGGRLEDAATNADAAILEDGGVENDAHVATDAGEAPADAGAADAGIDPGTPVRVVAANLTSGNFQTWDPGHGIRILQALGPDVILVQEFNYLDDVDADHRSFTDQVCGPSCEWYRAETGSIPNGIVSRWPIVEAGTWIDDEVGNRGFSWAHIDVPGPRDLWAVSLHLLTRNAGTRNREAEQLLGYIEATVPADAYLVVGGDLNTESRTEGTLQTLSSIVVTTGVPADRNGNGNTNTSRAQPYDWVLPDPDLEAHEVAVVLAGQRFESGLVFDTRVFEPLSSVPPAQFEDSDAQQMQHMAVVRDFLIPE